jgi:hypothetical protein
MLSNLNLILAAVAVVLVLYFAMQYNAAPEEPKLDLQSAHSNVYDLGMYDFESPNAYGTVAGKGRDTNFTVRPEYHGNEFPLAEGCTNCDKKGVPEPAMGHQHVCKCGFPSKRMVDAYGGSHFQLPHMCAPCSGEIDEPSQLGRWWKKSGCSNPESVGLDMRPICSRCGN